MPQDVARQVNNEVSLVQTGIHSRRRAMDELGIQDVEVRCGDGYKGWPEEAPFDLILVACAPSEPPDSLIGQLAPGGRLVVPVGDLGVQELVLIEKQPDGSTRRSREGGVAFVPMVRSDQS